MTSVSCITGETVEPKIRKQAFLPGSNQNFSVTLNTVKDPSHTPNGFNTHDHSKDAEQGEEMSTDLANKPSNHTLNIFRQQGRDIDLISTCIEGLQTQMHDIKTSIESLKANQNPSHLGQSSLNDHSFTKEIELLTENICDMNNKVHQIDGLNLELKMMKRRVQRLEDGNMSTQSSHTVTGLSQVTPRAKLDRVTGSLARRPLSSAGGASHPYKNADLRGSSNPKDGMEPSPELPTLDSRVKPVQQAFPSMSTNANQNVEPSSLLTQRQYLEQDELSGGCDGIVTAAVPSKPTATLKQHASIPETDVASSITSSSSSRLSPIQSRPPPKPTTPEISAAQGKPVAATSLNNHQVVLISDAEDNDYDPESYQHTTSVKGRSHVNNRKRGSDRRRRHAAFVKLPTPEWEKPEWTSPVNTTPSATRGRGIVRRGVGGRNLGSEPDFKRRKTTSNDERHERDLVPNDPSTGVSALNGVRDELRSNSSRGGKVLPLTRKGLPDSRQVKGARDEQGRLLRPDGRIDRRSIRYRKGTGDEDFDPRTASENENNDAILEAEKQAEMGNGDIATSSETEKLAQHRAGKQQKGTRNAEGSLSKLRDAEGYLLRPDGTRDGRSVFNRAQYLKSKSSKGKLHAEYPH